MRYVFQSRNGIGAERECEGGQRDIQKSREPQLRHLYNRDKLHKGALLLNTGVFHLKFCISCNVNGRKKNSEYLVFYFLKLIYISLINLRVRLTIHLQVGGVIMVLTYV